MRASSCTGRLGTRSGWRPAGARSARSGWHRARSAWRRCPPGRWAKTFGLPLELISPAEAQRAVPADVGRRRARRGVSADRRLHRPVASSRSRWPKGRSGAARRSYRTRASRDPRRTRAGRGVVTDKGDIEADVVVNAGGMFAAEIGADGRRDVPIVPMAHEYLVTRPPGSRSTCRRCATRRCWCTSGPSPAASSWAATSASRRRGRSTASRADFNGEAAGGGLAPLRAADGERDQPRAGAGGRWRSVRLINGPEAFTPDGEFILGPTDVHGFWVAAGFCAHGLAGAGGMGKLMAEWIVEGDAEPRRLAHGLAPLRRRLRDARVHARAHDRGLLDVLRHPVSRARAGGRAAAAPLARIRAPAGARRRRSARSPAGSGRTGSSRTRRPATRPAAARMGGTPLVAGDRRRAHARAARRRRSSTSRRSRRSRSSGAGAAELLERLCDNRVARDVGAITYTQMLNARGGIECDFTVTRLAEERFRIVTGTAFGRHDLAWIRQHAPGDGSVTVDDVTSAYACLGLWGPRAARSSRR